RDTTLDHPRAQQIVDVERVDHLVVTVDDEQAADLVCFHQLGGLDGETIRGDRLRLCSHDCKYGSSTQVDRVVVERAPQVAVGEYALELAVGIHHRGHAESPASHFDQRVAHRCLDPDPRNLVTDMHDVADV